MPKSHLRPCVLAKLQREFAGLRAGAASVRVGSLRLALCIACSLGACSLWSERQLREEGPSPFTRCGAAAAPRERSGEIAGVSIRVSERMVQLSKSAPGLRLAVFGAAGLGGPPSSAALERLRATRADVLLLLGGLGESPAVASATVKTLASLGRLVLVVLGGRDAYRVAHDALREAPDDAWILDATALRSIRIGHHVLIPWGGSEQGRYALDEGHCGFGARDVREAVAALGPAPAGERRWLASWQALPTASERAAIRDSDELGAQLVRLAESLGIQGSLAAWPADSAPEPEPGRLKALRVPRAWGPPDERSDGTPRPAGASVLVFETDGPRIER